MGKASRWFRALLGAKKSSDSSENKKLASARSSGGNDARNIGGSEGSHAEASSSGLYVKSSVDADKHAIAVAAATAAVAEAALAAAHAAAEVVKLTTSGGGSRPATACGSGNDRRRELAAVKIQSAFRTYLAMRALRALKGLVRLQALVRGHIVRKQSAEMLRRMQAMARIQARASANRSHSHLPESYKYHNPQQGLATTKKCNSQLRAFGSSKSNRSPILKSSQSNIKTMGNVDLGSNWLERWMKDSSWNSSQGDATPLKTGHANDERSDKILEVDTWKPHLNPKRSGKILRTPQHVKALPIRSLNFAIQEDQEATGTSEKNSPQVVYSAASSRPGSRGGSFTPAKSECCRSFFSDYPGYYPNYMANTESSRAKVRSQSAPRTRMQVEKLGSRRMFDHGLRDADTVSERAWTSHSNFSTKAYPGTGRLDRPVGGKRTNGKNSSDGAG